MHTFYKVLQKNTLRKKICVFLCALCTASLVVLSNANAAGYTCSNLTYVKCNSGYYLSDCGTTYDGRPIESPTSGNSCLPCPDGCTCSGDKTCPKLNKVSCDPGYYIKQGAKECNTTCLAGHYCTGGSYEISLNGADKDYGITPCEKGTYQDAQGQKSCKKCSDLDGVSAKDGTYTTDATGSTANTACKYTAPNKPITGCTSVTAATVTYNGTTWPATTYTVKANKGYVITNSGTKDATCTACGKGTYQPSDSSTAKNCTPCGTGTYQGNTGQSSCEACQEIANSTWDDSSGLTSDKCPFTCNDGYIPSGRTCAKCSTTQPCSGGYSGTYNSCAGETQNTQGKCYIDCEAGTYVAVAEGKCTSSVAADSKKYIGGHTVLWGHVSSLLNCPGDADGNVANAGSAKDCYKYCPAEKAINNGTATLASGHVYYSSDSKGYTDNQCKYSVDCDPRYGAQNTEGENTHNTNSPMCTLCKDGYWSAGNEGEQCKQCSGMPTGGVAIYTTNATTETGCLWHCNKGLYRHTTTVVASGGGGTKTTYSCNLCKTNTSIPVTSSWDPVDPKDLSKGYKNDKITGCYISSITANNQPTEVTDSTGRFKYRMNNGSFNPCYHK